MLIGKNNKISNEKKQTKNIEKNTDSIQLSKEIDYHKFLDNKLNKIDMISTLSTYDKIYVLQSLLKEMKSIKERLEENIDEMLKKISENCFFYYKSKIEIKEIFDYCQTNNPEINLNYNLCENSEEKLSNNYKILYDTFFLIRENYDIMLMIIKNCNPDSFEILADFLVNFFYENTVNSIFNAEELMIMIYLLIEDLIINRMPKSFFLILTKNNFDGEPDNSSFLNYIFKYITRKVDVRNFTCMILSSNILKLEEYKISLNICVQDINEELNLKKKDSIIKKNTDEHLIHSNDLNINQESPIIKNIKSLSPPMHDMDEEEYQNKFYQNDNDDNTDNNKRINIKYFFIDINQFFYETDVTLEFLNKKLADYENNSMYNTSINNAMKNYFDSQINLINNENCQIFSNYIKILELENISLYNKKENLDKKMNLIIENYTKITKFIDDIFEIIKSNLVSLPYILKSISFIIEILMTKKYNNKDIDYIKLMFLSNYFIGSVILPLIENPDFNGLIVTSVISRITRENLKLIHKIIKTMLSGKLFSNKTDFEFTIFNKYIIDTLPKIFNIMIMINLQKNFKLPNIIKKLILSSDDMNKTGRIIEYDYFKENQENIRQQSICFSLKNLEIIINSICSCSEIFINKKYNKYKKQFEKFIKLSALCHDNNNIKKAKFFLIEKITYSDNFKKFINNIMKDNIFAIMPNIQNDELSIFKNCFAELLSYVNILHKKNFDYSIQQKEESNIPLEKKLKKIYNNILFEDSETENDDYLLKNSEEKIYLKDFYEDYNRNNFKKNGLKEADFKDIIFPQIIDSLKSELNNNIDSEKAKRLVFCSSYLQTHISYLPDKYKENNYSLLYMEIIEKAVEIIKKFNLSNLHNFYSKIKGGEKLNLIMTNYLIQIKKIELWVCIQYLFEKINIPCKLVQIKDITGIVNKIQYSTINQKYSYINSIQSFINNFPNIRKYSKEIDDIIQLEEKIELDTTLNTYFKDIRNLIKKEKIILRFNKEEQDDVVYELENYILFNLYDKLYPKKSSKIDEKIYKKCCRLNFIKPENIIKDKNMINENLWKSCMILINEMDQKLTPADKVKTFSKAFFIIQNSITFCSGKNELGVDDTINPLVYVIIKSKPKNLSTNYKYCQLFLNKNLAIKDYGMMLSQIEMVVNIILDMKYTDLMGISEEQFGKDED